MTMTLIMITLAPEELANAGRPQKPLQTCDPQSEAFFMAGPPPPPVKANTTKVMSRASNSTKRANNKSKTKPTAPRAIALVLDGAKCVIGFQWELALYKK